MERMLNWLLLRIARKVSQEEFVCGYLVLRTFRVQRYRVQVDWLAVGRELQRKMDFHLWRPKKTGFAPWWLPCSLGYCGEECHIMIINPVQLSVKLAMLIRFRPDLLKELIAKLIAHECGHVARQHQWYGWLGFVFMPPLLLVPYLLPLTALIAVFVPALWGVCEGLIIAYFGAMILYLNHPHEREARHFARQHFEEWEAFVKVNPLTD